MSAAAWALGLNLLTGHSVGNYESATPGVYVRSPSGITAGVLRNSYGRTSAHAGLTFQTNDERFALTVGGITGYPARAVLPLLVPSVRLPIAGSIAARVGLLPKPPKHGHAWGLHLSLDSCFLVKSFSEDLL